MAKKAANFSNLIDGVRNFDSQRSPGEISYLDQLDAKIAESCKMYGVTLDENAAKAALIAFAMVDPRERTTEELAIVTCLSRHVEKE